MCGWAVGTCEKKQLPGLDKVSCPLESCLQCLLVTEYDMAQSKQQDDEDLALTEGYKPPAQKSLAEIANQDAEDESLRRYKEALLGDVSGALGCGKKVVVEKLFVIIPGREDIMMNLTGDLGSLKKSPFVMPEGIEYKLALEFKCPGEIVPGLRFITKIFRKGIKVDTLSYMVGSYGPTSEAKPVHKYTATAEEAPSGMLARGHYTAKSQFIDDDKTVHLAWEWAFEIKKKEK